MIGKTSTLSRDRALCRARLSSDVRLKMDISEFCDLAERPIELDKCSCEFEKFKSWTDAPLAQFSSLESKGRLGSETTFDTLPFPGKNYWDPDYPIAPSYYPQTDSEVWVCSACRAVFITYKETSGHSPQDRSRWVRSEIIRRT